MKYVAVALWFGASLLAVWMERGRRYRGKADLGVTVVLLAIALVAVLTGVMQAGALVAKGGVAITERNATGLGAIWMLFGVGMAFAVLSSFSPRENWGTTEDALLVGLPTFVLIVLLWFFEVP